jgi:dTDP-4-dehydrorhamnose 3,5-epimerase
VIIEALHLAGAYRIKLVPHHDDRGFFARHFCAATFAHHGLETDFVQRSISYNRRQGTLRGLHFQAPPVSETRLVRCARGALFDVIVDLRRNSPTYGQWCAEEMAAENLTMLYIPRGFAHGFQTLVDHTEVDYQITPEYSPQATRGVRYNDPQLGISWPISDPILSVADRTQPMFAELEPFFDTD